MIVMDVEVLAAGLTLLVLLAYEVAENYVHGARARDSARAVRLRGHGEGQELRLVRYPSASGPCR
jgi:hypothetical protein